MDFAMLPPEVNSGRMYAGPGSGPMLVAAAAWDTLAAELHFTAASYESVISGLTAGPWLGPASRSMAAAAAPYVDWMSATAVQAEVAAVQARAAASAYEAAFAMTVPPPVVAANRGLLAMLVATNILGQNTPAIAATEADYAEMWGQDAAAMYGYAGSSAAASTLTPFTPPPPTTDPGGVAGQAIAAIPQALQGLATPVSSAAALPALSTLGTVLTALAIPVAGVDTVAAATAAPASVFSGSASSVSATTTVRALRINADRDFAKGEGPFGGDGPGAALLPQWMAGGAAGTGEPSTVAAVPAAAGMGQRVLVGGLSVPSGWASAAPAFRPAAYALPITAAGAAPEMVAGNPGALLAGMGLASMAGGTAGSAVSGRGGERIPVGSRETPKPPSPPPVGAVTEIAAELSELAARASSLLAKLHESGFVTGGEVTQQQRRFVGS